MTFAKDESVLVRNQRGKKTWLPGKIIRQKGPVTYLVLVGNQSRFCHVDHLLKTGIKATSVIEEEDEISDLPNSNQRDERGESPDMSRSESDAVQDETVTDELPRATLPFTSPSVTTMGRHGSRTRQSTRRLIEEM